jgi:biotin carboxyl carrier protein
MTPTAHRRPGPKAYLLITALALLMVLLPFLFWYYTWFGRTLSDADLDHYFADTAHPRHAQHALVQLGERLSHHRDISRWYPNVLAQVASPNVELRQTAAWIMGQDTRNPAFHQALLELIHDPQPMVRRNAALSLAAFRDPAARPELVAMLRPYTITAPASGVLKYRLKLGEFVNPNTLVAHVGDIEVRSPVPGEVRALDQKDGTVVQKGQDLVDLAADKDHVWEALRGLVLVGQPADLEDVERYTRPVTGMPDTVTRQAVETAQAIRER